MGLGVTTLPLYNPSSFDVSCISQPNPTRPLRIPKVQRGTRCSRWLTLKSCNQHLTVD